MNKQLLKQVREYMQNRYEDIVAYLSYENDIEKHEEDINILLKYEPHFLDEVANIKQQLQLEMQEAEYQEKINDKISPQEHMLEYLKESLILNQEELNRLQNIKAKNKHQINKKNKSIDKVNVRIEELERCIKNVNKLIIELQPEKRKVGRPKKTKEKITSEKKPKQV